MTGSRIIRALGLFCTAGGALLCLAADWPQFLGPTRNGVSTETGLATSWPKKGPPVVWDKEVGEGFSGPVVVGDRLILFHRVGEEEVVECLGAADGATSGRRATPPSTRTITARATARVRRRWSPTAGFTRSAPTACCNAWSWTTAIRYGERSLHEDYEVRKGFFGVGTSPLLEGGRLLVNVGGANGAGIVAFDKDDGKEVWKADDHDASYSSPVAADVAGVRQAVFFTRDGLAALDPADGRIRYSKHWRSRMDASVNAATPLVVGDEIFLTACYGTGAVLLRAKKDGVEEIWKGDKSLSCHYGTPVYKDGYLYGFDGRQEEGARLRCVEMKSGKVQWTSENFGCGSMILADGNLVILSEDGDLVLAKATPEKYQELARAAVLTNRPCRAPLALADGKLYGRDGKKLVCWNLKEK